MQTSEQTRRKDFLKRFMSLMEEASKAPSGPAIVDECLCLAEMLVQKNTKYGNSALNPKRIFSTSDTIEQIRVRIDDKLSRQMRGTVDDEDIVSDLLGYLILLRIATQRLNAGVEIAASRALPSTSVSNIQVVAPSDECLAFSVRQAETFDTSNVVCQECGVRQVEGDSAVCDVCYKRRFGREKIDLSHVQG